MLGTERRKFQAGFVYLSDDDPEPITDDGFLTWYDSRERHPIRSEYRLYFSTNRVTESASEGDLLVIGRRPDDTLLIIVAEADSTIETQIRWLFGGSDATYPEFSVKGELESNQVKLEFASRYILEQIGIEIEDTDESFLDRMLREFPDGFPTTRTFSDFARSTVRGVSPADDPDELIMAYMEREEVLFRTLERHLIGDRLQNGFADTDTFLTRHSRNQTGLDMMPEWASSY
jgi:hypothetical protein